MAADQPRWAHQWEPRNLGGAIYHDPRRELEYWASSTPELWVAVPVATLRAIAAVKECSDRRTATHDEDGELSAPVEMICRLPAGHLYAHSNGYASWDAQR